MMIDAAEALTAKNRTINGEAGMSLCDIGYCSVGVDEGWEGCGQGVDHTQHEADGTPTIDGAFPDTAGMVQKIHGGSTITGQALKHETVGLGLKAGWYLNGCTAWETKITNVIHIWGRRWCN